MEWENGHFTFHRTVNLCHEREREELSFSPRVTIHRDLILTVRWSCSSSYTISAPLYDEDFETICTSSCTEPPVFRLPNLTLPSVRELPGFRRRNPGLFLPLSCLVNITSLSRSFWQRHLHSSTTSSSVFFLSLSLSLFIMSHYANQYACLLEM